MQTHDQKNDNIRAAAVAFDQEADREHTDGISISPPPIFPDPGPPSSQMHPVQLRLGDGDRSSTARSPLPYRHTQHRAGLTIQRDIDPELLRERIQQMRTENLMVLYVDAHRRDDTQGALYQPISGVGGRRRAYSQQFIQRHRRLILREYEGAIGWLVEQHRWETLHWLYHTFPALPEHFPAPPDGPLERLRSIIQSRSEAVRHGEMTGWEHIQHIPETVREQREEEERGREEGHQTAEEASRDLCAAFRNSTGERAHWIVFSSSAVRTLGGHAHGLPANWVEGLVRYIRTVNELRSGGSPSAHGIIPRAPVTMTALMVTRATHDFNALTRDQREILRNDDLWGNIVVPQLWRVLRERFDWGVTRADMPTNLKTFQEGRFRNPPQSVF